MLLSLPTVQLVVGWKGKLTELYWRQARYATSELLHPLNVVLAPLFFLFFVFVNHNLIKNPFVSDSHQLIVFVAILMISVVVTQVGLAAYGATANGGDVSASFAQYSALFQEQLFVHVMSLDFIALWLLSPWVKY